MRMSVDWAEKLQRNTNEWKSMIDKTNATHGATHNLEDFIVYNP